MTEWKAWLKLFRPPLMLLGFISPLALCVWVGKPIVEIFFIVLAVFFGNIGWNAANDYYDFLKGVDSVNKSWKPLPSGQLNPDSVLSTYQCLLIVSIFFNLMLIVITGNHVYILGFVIHGGSYIYNVRRKDIVGNLGMFVAYTLVVVMIVYPEHLRFALGFGLLTIAFNLCVQYQDLYAELSVGVITVPAELERRTAPVSFGLALASGGLFLWEYTLYQSGPLFLLMFIVGAIFTLASSVTLTFVIPEDIMQEILNRIITRIAILVGFLFMLFGI